MSQSSLGRDSPANKPEPQGLALKPPTNLKEPAKASSQQEQETSDEEATTVFSSSPSDSENHDQPEEDNIPQEPSPATPTSTLSALIPPQILWPENRARVNQSAITLAGQAATSITEILLQLNSATTTIVILPAIDGTWQQTIDLRSGENHLQVWAKAADGQLSDKVHWQIFLDSQGPEIILSIVAHQMVSRQITLLWQPASAVDALDIANYVLEIKPPSSDWQALWQQAISSQKTFSGFDNGLYQFRTCGQDALGNQGAWQQVEVLFEERPVVINEIAWMGTQASTNDEWLELYNRLAVPLDLTGWTLRAQDKTPSTTLAGLIEPYGYYLLERTDDQTISDIPADQIYTGALNNDGENLILKDAAGNVVDDVNFSSGWPEGDNDVKASMERIRPEFVGSDPDSWMTNLGLTKNGRDAGGQTIVGTPRRQNSYVQDGGTKLPNDLRIRGTITWRKKLSPYLLGFNMDDYVVVESGAQLIIEPGTTLKMGLTYLSLRVYGELEAKGTDTAPIVFEPYEGVDAWSAIVLEPASQAEFNLVRFKNGGARGFYHEGGGWSAEHWTETAIVAAQAGLTLTNCEFSGIRLGAVKINGGNSLIQKNLFSGGSYHLDLTESAAQVQENIFQDNEFLSGYALKIYSGQPQILNNQFDGIATLAFLAGGNPYFSGNTSRNTQKYDGILVDDGARFREDASWQPNFPYILEVNFRDQARVLAGASLTLEPGVVVKMMGYADVAGYENLIIEGALKAQAPTSTPVIFTSLFDDTIAGDTNCDGSATAPLPRPLPSDGWRGLFFTNSSAGSVLDGVLFRYASQAIIKESAGVDLTIGQVDYY